MVEKNKKSLWMIIPIAALAYASLYIARANFSIASAVFAEQGLLDERQIGVIGSVFSFSYALSKIPNGYLGDRFSTRSVMILGLVITSVSNLLIGLFPRFLSMAILWGCNAYGQSMLWGPLMRTFSFNYGEEVTKTIGRIFGATIALGNIAGILLASWCASALGVAACFLVPAAITGGVALALRLFFIDAPGNKTRHENGIFNVTTEIFHMKQFRSMIFPAVAHGMIKDNITIWLAVYFIDTFAIDIKAIAGYVFFVPLLTFISKLIYPLIFRLLKNDYLISIVSFGICVLLSARLCANSISATEALICLAVISSLISLINSLMLVVFPTELVGTEQLSFACSIMDLLTYGGAGIGSLIFGMLIQSFGYKSMFFTWLLCSTASTVVLYCIYNGRKKSS